MNKDELWNSTRAEFLNGVGPDDLKTIFIQRLKPLVMTGSSLVLLAENAQVEDWVNKNYLDELKASAERAAGRPMEIVVAADSDRQEAPQQQMQGSSQGAAPQEAFEQGKQETADSNANEPEWLNTYVDPRAIARGSKEQGALVVDTPKQAVNHQVGERHQGIFAKCTFDTFVTGAENEFAYSAAIAVAEDPGKQYNPLFIYGNPGLGKTHLLVSIANYVNASHPMLKTVYVDANDLVKDFTEAMQESNWTSFNQRYHHADVLLVDDVQYLEGKEGTINQFFNIFNEMTSQNRQVVLSADRAPKDIDMETRMTSRFSQGLLVDIKPPTYETRLAILKNYVNRLANERNFAGTIPDEVLGYLADISTSSVREMEGAANRLISEVVLHHRESITVDETRELFKDFFPDAADRKIKIETIMEEVGRFYQVSHGDLVSNSRKREIALARHVGVYLARNMTEMTLGQIGQKFGGRDHSTCMHSVKKIEEDIRSNRSLFEQVEQIKSKIKASN